MHRTNVVLRYTFSIIFGGQASAVPNLKSVSFASTHKPMNKTALIVDANCHMGNSLGTTYVEKNSINAFPFHQSAKFLYSVNIKTFVNMKVRKMSE